MSGLSDIRKTLSSIEMLERELNLKQLQIRRLLKVTQAINNNESARDLFSMYEDFLRIDLGVRRMALFFFQDEEWICQASIDIEHKELDDDLMEILPKYREHASLENEDHPFLQQFDVVIPVLHKDLPLAYSFIGGFNENEDLYNKVQFITTITNIIAVAIENKRLFKRQLEQERLSREMELASEMQRTLIPHQLPNCCHYQLASIYKPHMLVGGDYFDFIELDNNKFIFCIGDITGKGVAAALLMANFQAYFHTLIKEKSNLKEFVESLIALVLRSTRAEKFLTFFVGEYDRDAGVLRYVNAGHNPPVMAQRNQLTRLKTGCTILGIFDELPGVEVGEIKVDSETLILLFTDGLTDIQNPKGEYLDEATGFQFVLDNAHLSAEAFNAKLTDQIEAFMGTEGGYPDDFTVLTCKIFA